MINKPAKIVLREIDPGQSVKALFLSVNSNCKIVSGILRLIDTEKRYSYCIVKDESYRDHGNGVFQYSHWLAREILAGLMRPEKNGQVVINGNLFVVEKNATFTYGNKLKNLVNSVEIRESGGYFGFRRLIGVLWQATVSCRSAA